MIYDNLKNIILYDIYNDYDGINNIKTINDNRDGGLGNAESLICIF